MKKAVSTAMALSMMVGLMGVNASAYEAGSYDGVSITMLNTKSEIQDYLVDAAAEWGELTGAIAGCLHDQRQRITVSGDRSQICSEQCTDPDHGRCTGRS